MADPNKMRHPSNSRLQESTMQWSKLQKAIESRFAPSVHGKIRIRLTSYTKSTNRCRCGRVWITYNREQIVNFGTIQYLHRAFRDRQPLNQFQHVIVDSFARTSGVLAEHGEWGQDEFLAACTQYLRLSINAALSSENPIIQGLAFLDERAGKRSLSAAATKQLHPLPRRLLEIRRLEENVRVAELTTKD
jgi:hypothetical protein